MLPVVDMIFFSFFPSSLGVRRERLLLSGYGVELAIKKAEYTVVDDSQISGTSISSLFDWF